MSQEKLPDKQNTLSADSWRVFRILSEFVDGFEKLVALGPSVSIFGSARMPSTSPYYQQGMELAKILSEKGFGIITGGGPGLMEAANKAAQLAKGKSCGLSIQLPHELKPNDYIDPPFDLRFRYFFVRKVMFVRYAQGCVFLPGGFGTLDEFFEVLTLIQTKRIKPIPVFLMGKEYWQGLLQWLSDAPVSSKSLNSQELELIQLTDDPQEIAEKILDHYKQTELLENF